MVEWGLIQWIADKLPIRRWWRHYRSTGGALPPTKATQFSILITDLAGDSDGSQTAHVTLALGGQPGIRVERDGRMLEVSDLGDQGAMLAEAEAEGRLWLRERKADILVWGQVAAKDKALRLRFLSANPSGDQGAQSYTLGKSMELPEDFSEDFAQVLYAVALSAVAPATEQQGKYLAQILKPAAAKIERLLDHPPDGQDPQALASIHHSYGVATVVIGEQSGEREWLGRAVAAFTQALSVFTRDALPLDWAMTQNNLAIALAILGEQEEGTARLEEAVDAFHAALEVYTRDALPLQWAGTQNNLGNALKRLDEREEGTARLKAAVDAYRAALEVRTRDALPLAWAMTQINLGSALTRIGEREEGTARLEEAVDAFHAALEVCTRNALPIAWANTQNNLGDTLRVLGEREKRTVWLEEAVNACQAALEVRTRDALPHQWAETRNNLANALLRIGEREEGMERLEEAIAVYRTALEVSESGDSVYLAGIIRKNLTAAEFLVAKRRTQE